MFSKACSRTNNSLVLLNGVRYLGRLPRVVFRAGTLHTKRVIVRDHNDSDFVLPSLQGLQHHPVSIRDVWCVIPGGEDLTLRKKAQSRRRSQGEGKTIRAHDDMLSKDLIGITWRGPLELS